MSLIFYFASIVGTLRTLLLVFSVIVFVIMLITKIVEFCDDEVADQIVKRKANPMKYLIISGAVMIMSCFIPKEKTIYLMGGVSVIENMIQNSQEIQQLPDKSVRVLNLWLDSLSDELDGGDKSDNNSNND